LGVVGYMLGMSYRGTEAFMGCLGCRSGKSSIERDVAEAAAKAQQLHQSAPRMRVRVLGVDGTGAAMAGCKNAAPERRHRICLTHWRKSKGKRAWDLHRRALAEDRPLEAESMKQLQELLRQEPRPPTVPQELERLVRRYIKCRKGLLWKINQLLQHVERTWEQVSDDPRDPANNATERIIGLTLKIRSKTMRGFKVKAKVLAHPYLASFLRGSDGLCDLRQVI